MPVFAGGFDFEATAADAGGDRLTVLDGLTTLIDQSLLLHEQRPGGTDRVGVLETIREYEFHQLRATGKEAATRDRHEIWCLDMIETAWPPRSTAPPNNDALSQLEIERDNDRTALA